MMPESSLFFQLVLFAVAARYNFFLPFFPILFHDNYAPFGSGRLVSILSHNFVLTFYFFSVFPLINFQKFSRYFSFTRG